MSKRCLVVGMGSAGSRHAKALLDMGHTVSVVSSRPNHVYSCFNSLGAALESRAFDYVVISNRTSDHYEAFCELKRLGHEGLVLIEKPVFAKRHDMSFGGQLPAFVGYDLRFHPILKKVRKMLEGKSIYSIQAYVGQYLPDWRVGRDYAECYSAHREQGGGVLRDLSHELDYLTWIAGPCRRVAAVGGTVSSLNINSDDMCCLLMETERCPAIVCQMNYLDRQHRREMIINHEDGTLRADLINGTLAANDQRASFETGSMLTTASMHKEILSGDMQSVCTLVEGLTVVSLIEAVEESMAGGKWCEL